MKRYDLILKLSPDKQPINLLFYAGSKQTMLNALDEWLGAHNLTRSEVEILCITRKKIMK